MPQTIATAYAHELKTIRLRLGLTQAQMGAQLGIRGDSLSRYEREERRVPEPTIRLARHLLAGR